MNLFTFLILSKSLYDFNIMKFDRDIVNSKNK